MLLWLSIIERCLRHHWNIRSTLASLALQGAYDAHAKVLAALGATPRLVRTPEQLVGLDGLIIPGGESTTILKFLERDNFFEALAAFVAEKPTFGTCAGAILLATGRGELYAKVVGCARYYGRAECLRAAERIGDSELGKQPGGRPAGDGLHSSAENFARWIRGRDAGETRG